MTEFSNKFGSKKCEPPCELVPCNKGTLPLPPAGYGPIVTVEVGTCMEARRFSVYKGLLSHYSTYFKNALKSCWVEGSKNEIYLPYDNSEVFAAFFNWLYDGKLYFNLAADGSIPLGAKLVCEVYIFGDTRGIPDLCNIAIDTLFQVCVQTHGFPKEGLTYIWDNTVEHANMRTFLVDFAVENYTWTGMESDRECYPGDFLLDVIAASRRAGGTPGNIFSVKASWIKKKKKEVCSKYHDHEDAH